MHVKEATQGKRETNQANHRRETDQANHRRETNQANRRRETKLRSNMTRDCTVPSVALCRLARSVVAVSAAIGGGIAEPRRTFQQGARPTRGWMAWTRVR